MVFDQLCQFVSDDLWNAEVFHSPSLLIGKVCVSAMPFWVSQTLQSTLESGQEARLVQFDFSAAFNRVNHQIFSISPVLWVLQVMSLIGNDIF